MPGARWPADCYFYYADCLPGRGSRRVRSMDVHACQVQRVAPTSTYAWTACKQQCKFKGLQFELLDWYCRVCNAGLLHCSAPIDVPAHVPPQVKLAVGRASPRTCTATCTCTDIDTSGRGWQPYHNKYLCMHRHLDMHLHEFDFEPHSISIAPAAAVHRHHRAAELEL